MKPVVKKLKDNVVYNKSFDFAVKIVGIYKYLTGQKKEYVLSKQLLRSGTSIGANVKEAINAQSKRDFLSKMSIALKEASETEYWLELLIKTECLGVKIAEDVLADCKEINKILISITKTTRNSI